MTVIVRQAANQDFRIAVGDPFAFTITVTADALPHDLTTHPLTSAISGSVTSWVIVPTANTATVTLPVLAVGDYPYWIDLDGSSLLAGKIRIRPNTEAGTTTLDTVTINLERDDVTIAMTLEGWGGGSGGGGSGIVETVVAGTAITVNATDPANPIVGVTPGSFDAAGAATAVAGTLTTHAALTTAAHGGIVASSDARLTDARTPTAHAATHATAGSDPVTAAAIGAATTGALAAHEADTTAIHGITNTANLIVEGDARLTNARTPSAHAASHADGGTDEVSIDGSQITTGTVADARIAATIARDSEVTSAIAGKADTASAVMDGDAAGGVLAGTYPSPSFAADMATQAELDTHEADTTAVHGIANTANLVLTDDYRINRRLLTTAGEVSVDRRFIVVSGSTYSSGSMHLCYFIAERTETINTLTLITGTAATAVTLCRYAVYSVAGNGDLTLIASTPNDATLWAVAATAYPKALSAPWSKVAGQLYAIGALHLGSNSPTMVSSNSQSAGTVSAEYARAPRISSVIGGQTDLPSTVTAASAATGTVRVPYVVMT